MSVKEKKKKMNAELKAVCLLRAQKQTRYSLLLLLMPLLFLFHPTALYMMIILFLFPAAVNYTMLAARPEQDKEYMSHALLRETLHKYHFSCSKYRTEQITFIGALLLLGLWQWIQQHFLWHGLPVWRIPGILLIFCFITENILYLYFRLRIRHDFFHLKIDS